MYLLQSVWRPCLSTISLHFMQDQCCELLRILRVLQDRLFLKPCIKKSCDFVGISAFMRERNYLSSCLGDKAKPETEI